MDEQSRIGFMQGRLSPLVENRIQAFPWYTWEAEFPLARAIGFKLMEWTLDYDRIYENPLLHVAGRHRIAKLCEQNAIAIPSVTADFFMQRPYFKFEGRERDDLVSTLCDVLRAMSEAGGRILVLPLVDAGRLVDHADERAFRSQIPKISRVLQETNTFIAIESDFPPIRLRTFIETLDPAVFSINYDSGNSASLGFDVGNEWDSYAHRITNVHIKDRLLGGATVPLGTGNADLPRLFQKIAEHAYTGHLILQTARDPADHAGVLRKYRDQTLGWLEQYGP